MLLLKVQQPPYSYPHSRKCRALMHAYLSHVPLPGPLHEGVSYCQQSDWLYVCIQIDLLKILNICPMLLQELLSVLKELTIFALLYPKRGTSYMSCSLKILRVKNFKNFCLAFILFSKILVLQRHLDLKTYFQLQYR